MTECAVLSDLKVQRATLKHGMAKIKKDLKLCASCQDKCPEYQAIRIDIKQAIRETLDEIQDD